MKISFIQNFIDFLRAEIEFNSKAPVKLFYVGNGKYNNAGDMFNIEIMRRFNIPFIKSRVSAANVFNLGSVLNFLLSDKNHPKFQKQTKCLVVGSGFIQEPTDNEIILKDLKILALRGKLSKNIIENMTDSKIDCLLADPGILASLFFEIKNADKKYKVGIIPHCHEKNKVSLDNIKLEKYNSTIIDIEAPFEELFEKICECECIISSSLHGLIFSDSYNIPNHQIILSDKIVGELFKFKDYYSAFDIPFKQPFDLRKTIINDSVIDEIIAEYKPLNNQIKEKQKKLVNIYSTLLDNL